MDRKCQSRDSITVSLTPLDSYLVLSLSPTVIGIYDYITRPTFCKSRPPCLIESYFLFYVLTREKCRCHIAQLTYGNHVAHRVEVRQAEWGTSREQTCL